jgi:hypothetical protein
MAMSPRALHCAVALSVALSTAAAPAFAQDGLFRTRTQIYGWGLAQSAFVDGANAEAGVGRLVPPHSDRAARFGRFGLWSDALGLPAESGTYVSPGAMDGPLDGGLRARNWAWTVAGSYAAVETPNVDLHTLAGMRRLNTEIAVDSASGLGDARDAWDAVLGVRGRVKLGEGRWFAPYYLDVGTGQSDFTWQAFGGIGYAFSWGEIVGSWRHLDYNFATTSRIRDLTFSGPTISFGFRW